MTWVVYGIYVRDDLRYIGSTDNPNARRLQHSVARYAGISFDLREMDVFADEATARTHEAALIRERKPPDNVVHNSLRCPVSHYIDVQVEMGGRIVTSRLRFRKEPLPLEHARRVWTESACLQEAMSRMTGWSICQAYAAFGRRVFETERQVKRVCGASGRRGGPKPRPKS